MSNGSGQEGDTARVSGPSQPAARQDDLPALNEGDDTLKRQNTILLKGPQSLERLRDRVKKAAHELERLRTENAALTERIRRLESRPAVDLDGTVLAFDEDPDVLREKVEGFIQAIDTYLAKETE
jgi:hypothetical protein